MTCYRVHEGSSDGEMVMVRVLTSHQCGLGSNPGPGIIGGFMLVLTFLQGLFSTVSGVLSSTKTNTFNSNLVWKQWMKSLSVGCTTANSLMNHVFG